MVPNTSDGAAPKPAPAPDPPVLGTTDASAMGSDNAGGWPSDVTYRVTFRGRSGTTSGTASVATSMAASSCSDRGMGLTPLTSDDLVGSGSARWFTHQPPMAPITTTAATALLNHDEPAGAAPSFAVTSGDMPGSVTASSPGISIRQLWQCPPYKERFSEIVVWQKGQTGIETKDGMGKRGPTPVMDLSLDIGRRVPTLKR